MTDDILMWQTAVGLFSATYITPMVTELCKRWEFGERFSASVAMLFNLLLYVLGWFLFSHDSQMLKYWIMFGMGVGGSSSAYHQASKTTILPNFPQIVLNSKKPDEEK